MDNRFFYGFFVVLLAMGCGPGSNSRTATGISENQKNEPALATDGRLSISLSNAGLIIKGSPVQLGKTTKQELQNLIGPPDHVVALEPGLRHIGLWDTLGIRVYWSPRDDKLEYLDCLFVTNAEDEMKPRSPYGDIFRIEGVDLSKNTTKRLLQHQGQLGQKI